MWTNFNYFVDGNQNPFDVNNKSLLMIWDSNTLILFCFVFLQLLCVYLCLVFMNIMFELGFLCIASEYIFLNH
jgi:hypothetical protein